MWCSAVSKLQGQGACAGDRRVQDGCRRAQWPPLSHRRAYTLVASTAPRPGLAHGLAVQSFMLCRFVNSNHCRVPAHRVCEHGARPEAEGVHCPGGCFVQPFALRYLFKQVLFQLSRRCSLPRCATACCCSSPVACCAASWHPCPVAAAACEPAHMYPIGCPTGCQNHQQDRRAHQGRQGRQLPKQDKAVAEARLKALMLHCSLPKRYLRRSLPSHSQRAAQLYTS